MAIAANTTSTSSLSESGPTQLFSVRTGGKNRQARQQYQRALIETASPTRLIVLLYDGAVRFCGMAIEAIEAKDLEGQNQNLIKAQRILGELISSLDKSAGGEVAENLSRLYVHMLEQLVNANLNDDIEPVKTVQRMLMELRDTWQEVDRMTMQGNVQGAEITSRAA
jgi:flagellar protein FliS